MNKSSALLRAPSAAVCIAACGLSMLFPAASARADDSTNAAAGAASIAATNATTDLTELPLETLLQIQVPHVVSASKFDQKTTEAPASITILTSEDIKRYGYRTLGDVIASVQGFYTSYDRNYGFLGVRGVNLGDANSRILLLVNGHRINNDLNDSAPVDTSFILDLDLIDRIEIIRGPSAVLYGNNAFFGVINVITRKGSQVNGVEASGSYGTYDTYSGRVTVGGQFTNGPQFMLSGTVYNSDGVPDLFYPQFNTPAQNNGVAHDLDADGYGSFFGSVGWGDFSVEGGYIERRKVNPTAQYDTTFNDPRLRTIDTRSYATVKYAHQFEDAWDVSANVYYDQSDFQIDYPEDPLLFRETQSGQWAGAEAQVDKKIWDKHIITFGAEYRNDFELDREVFEPENGNVFTDVHDHRQNFGVFGQGDFAIVTNLHLNAGVRFDKYGSFDPKVSPRVALIYDPWKQSTFKLIFGQAFRDPNFVELSDPRFQDIQPEGITSYEVVYEQGILQNLRSSVAGYYNQMQDLIDFENGAYTNFNANGLGLELALEGQWANQVRMRLSYTLQHTQNSDTGNGLPDSPLQQVKLNVSVPVFTEKLLAGLEVQYTSERGSVFTDLSGATLTGLEAPGYPVVNLTLLSREIVKNLEISASVYNLFDQTYYDPSSNFHLQDLIQQDGRTFRVKVTYRF